MKKSDDAWFARPDDARGEAVVALAELLRTAGYLEPNMSPEETTRVGDRVRELVRRGKVAVDALSGANGLLLAELERSRVENEALHKFVDRAVAWRSASQWRLDKGDGYAADYALSAALRELGVE